jgi:uncharacterized protein (TIGR03435 family)
VLRTVLLALIGPLVTLAQVTAPAQFEVASVKLIPGPVGFHNTILNMAHGSVHLDYAALRQITGLAYGIQRVRVVGGPEWMDSDLYRVEAKAENSDISREQVQAMLQALLQERFKLAVHHETRQLPVYTLVVDKGGSKLRESKEPGRPLVSMGAPETGQFGGRPLVFHNMSLAGLVNTVANVLGTPVIDQTGLKGSYDFTLEWSTARPLPESDVSGVPRATPVGPSIIDAVREQLGLKMEEKKGPVDVLFVDHAEKATEN